MRQVNRMQAGFVATLPFSTATRDPDAALRLSRASVADVWVIKLSLIRLVGCEIQAKYIKHYRRRNSIWFWNVNHSVQNQPIKAFSPIEMWILQCRIKKL